MDWFVELEVEDAVGLGGMEAFSELFEVALASREEGELASASTLGLREGSDASDAMDRLRR